MRARARRILPPLWGVQVNLLHVPIHLGPYVREVVPGAEVLGEVREGYSYVAGVRVRVRLFVVKDMVH